MSATAGQAAEGVRSLADRFGIEPGMVVMEMGYDDDVDEDLRDALIDRCGELVDEDTDEVVDAVLLWYRDGDGDLVELLIDALGPLADNGVVWLLTPKAGRSGDSAPPAQSRSAERHDDAEQSRQENNGHSQNEFCGEPAEPIEGVQPAHRTECMPIGRGP